MKTTVIGAFPKLSDDPGGQELRRALHRFDRGEIDQAALSRVYHETTVWAIGELERSGIDVINDGQILWDDLLAPLAGGWGNTERGPLERFYDNNTYFRQPVITGPITCDGRLLVTPFKEAKELAARPLKAAIAGPLTFATLTAEDRAYKDVEARTMAVAGCLMQELRGLKKCGATLVDVEDPAVVARPELIGLARAAYEVLAQAGVDLAIQPYFFPADRVLDELATFPVAQVGIDLRSRETGALARVGALGSKTVVLGVVDARNTRLETESEVARKVETAARALGEERVWAAPTTSLEYLPHDVALKKLAVLVAGTRSAAGAGVGAPASGARA